MTRSFRPQMMAELKATQQTVRPTDTLLVVDAMTGQEAANLVRSFSEQVELTGAVLTKLDGDSRGGAALSVRATSGKPIKFTGVGEKMEALEVSCGYGWARGGTHEHPIAVRIDGDLAVLSLLSEHRSSPLFAPLPSE